MKQCLATLTVTFALLGVLTGSLLRPCDCGQGGGPALDAASVARKSQQATCCCCGSESPTRDEGEDGNGHDGCKLCSKPAPPAVEASAAPAFAPPALVAVSPSPPPAPVPQGITVTGVRGPAGPPAGPPWRISQEGLTVFLL